MSLTSLKENYFYCQCCDYTAKNRSRYMQHLGTLKHGRNYLKCLNAPVQEPKKEKEEETIEFIDLDNTVIESYNQIQSIKVHPFILWIIGWFHFFQSLMGVKRPRTPLSGNE
tara:strand:- start:173 stop:508 length:336 start_codon:yes stop_codon:yes gene_type:complete